MTNKRLLIIDDDVELCEELTEALSSEGFLTTSVSESREGQKLAQSGDFDAIILDNKMSGITGVELVKSLSENIRRKVLLISGKPFMNKELEEAGLLDTIGGLLAKPIDLNSIIAKIKDIVR